MLSYNRKQTEREKRMRVELARCFHFPPLWSVSEWGRITLGANTKGGAARTHQSQISTQKRPLGNTSREWHRYTEDALVTFIVPVSVVRWRTAHLLLLLWRCGSRSWIRRTAGQLVKRDRVQVEAGRGVDGARGRGHWICHQKSTALVTGRLAVEQLQLDGRGVDGVRAGRWWGATALAVQGKWVTGRWVNAQPTSALIDAHQARRWLGRDGQRLVQVGQLRAGRGRTVRVLSLCAAALSLLHGARGRWRQQRIGHGRRCGGTVRVGRQIENFAHKLVVAHVAGWRRPEF